MWPHKNTWLKDHMKLWLGFLIECHHPAKFVGHIYYGSGDSMFLTYHVFSQDHMT